MVCKVRKYNRVGWILIWKGVAILKLEQLHQILEIEKYQSISKAAKEMFMAQSSLSGSLNSLENEIGVRLFERNSDGVAPTPEGRDILQLARQVLEGCDMIMSYSSQNRELHGEVKLYITQAYGFLYSDLMMLFHERFPKATLNLEVVSQHKVVEALAQGNGNIGLTMWGFTPDQTEDVFDKSNLNYEKFYSHDLMLFVSQDNQLADKSGVTIPEVNQEKIISYSSSYWATINRRLNPEMNPVVMKDREALKRMVSTGQGVAVLPDTFALHDLYCEQGMIKMIPIQGSEKFGTAEDYLLHAKKRRLTVLEQKTLDVVREVLREFVLD